MKKSISIDIGASSVKLIELAKTGKGIEVLRARIVEIDVQQIADSDDKARLQTRLVNDAIRQILSEEKIRNPKVTISISGQSCIVRSIKLPRVSKHKIGQIVKYEAQQQVPFPMDEVIWDYEVLSSSSAPETDVILVAVKKEVIQDIMSHLVSTKVPLDIAIVDAVPVALYNAVSHRRSIDRPLIVLDIGTQATNLIIVENKKMWARSIPMGGENTTHAIAEKYNTRLKEAEDLKRKEGALLMDQEQMGVSSTEQQEISRTISFSLMDILSEVSRSIGFYKIQSPGVIFGGIYLTGGGSNLKGIDKFFEKNLNIPVMPGGMFDSVSVSANCYKDFKERTDFSCRFSVAFGMALRDITDVPISINLLPSDYANARQVRLSVPYFFMAAALAAGIIYMGGQFVKVDNERKNSELNMLKKERTELKAHETRFKELKSQIEPQIQKVKFLENITKARQYWLNTIININKDLPQEVWITNFMPVFEKDTIKIRMRAKTDNSNLQGYATVSEVPNKLSKTGRFQDVVISDISEEEVIPQKNIVFTITAEVVNPELQRAILFAAAEEIGVAERKTEVGFPGMPPMPPGAFPPMPPMPGEDRRRREAEF